MPQINTGDNPQRKSGTSRVGDVTVTAREKITVTGVEEVISFDEGSVIMATTGGTLTVDGEGLNVTKLDLTGGEVVICGHFIGMYYIDPRKKSGRRLFGRG